MKKIITLLFLMISSLCFAAEYNKSPNLVEGTLPNGMKYYIYKNKKPENKAFIQLAVKAGSMQEEKGDEGIAHILEHMAFNGTKKYKKNDVIKYLESIGLSFGGDLNAHTGFEETVYQLTLPTDEKDKYEKGIEILREWANEIDILDEELESEKKVVLEEWRLSQGLTERLGLVQKKLLFEGSPFYEKYPIGTVETINASTKESLNKFYKRWYHPKNMAIIAVGDFDVQETENLIKKYFDYTPETEYEAPKKFSIEEVKNRYEVFTDAEIGAASLQIIKVNKRDVILNGDDYKNAVIKLLTANIVNTRLSNLIKENETPLNAGLYMSQDMTNANDIDAFIAIIKNEKILEGIEYTKDIVKNMIEQEITEVEFDLEKSNLLSSRKMMVANKDSISHSKYGSDLLKYYNLGQKFVEVEDKYEFLKEVINEITLKDLNDEIKNIFEGEAIYFLSAQNDVKNIPDNAKLEEMIKSGSKNQNPIDFSVKKVELPPIELKAGEILEKKQEENTKYYKLSNGINVHTKKTDFDKDKIYIRLFKTEGNSSSDYDEFLNTQAADSIVMQSGFHNLTPKDLDTYQKGKNFAISPYITTYEQGISISTDGENVIPALESLSYLVREPKVDENIFNENFLMMKEHIRNKENSPEDIYWDKIDKIYYNSHERKSPLTFDDLEKITKEGTLSAFKSKFSNFNGFNLVIVGSFDEDKIEELLKKYFASLPTSEPVKEVKKLELDIPKNIISKNVVKGVDKKTEVAIIFPYKGVYGEKERELYHAFSKILNIYLMENIREKLGGAYSISSSVDLDFSNYGDDKLSIMFSCDTSRLDEIKAAAVQTVKDMLDGKFDEEKVDGIVKNYESSYKKWVNLNEYWIAVIRKKIIVGDSHKVFTPEEYKVLINKKDILEFSKKAVSMDNYININLVPEKEEL